MSVRSVKFWYWLVDRLPNKLVYFCFMKVGAYATTGIYSNTDASEITMMHAIKRYSDDKKIKV